ncbi:hypothetical protein Syun_031353 [Stephania yunnanensis]|uniref:Retrovirus-related Pol polyprotein from transposon TNT 1-94 n=1 Tax=Stephania yunnanensis TaxID=152371 RepID=A0AAP0HDQ0_9MAGN
MVPILTFKISRGKKLMDTNCRATEYHHNYLKFYLPKCNNLHLVGYTDVDWGGDLDERKSTSGYVFLPNNGVISWSSKKQSCIALSTMEAKFVACSAAVQEAVWRKRFLSRLGFDKDASSPVLVNCDSQAAIAFTRDPKYH